MTIEIRKVANGYILKTTIVNTLEGQTVVSEAIFEQYADLEKCLRLTLLGGKK